MAKETIGKTTIKAGSKAKESGIIRSIRNEKRSARKAFEKEPCPERKMRLRDSYIKKQHKLKKQIEYEYQNGVERKFSKMREIMAFGKK